MNGKFHRNLLIILTVLLSVATFSAAPGDLDPTFGNGGIVIKPVMSIGHYYQASSILLQPDGKILVSGQIDEYGDMVSFFIARFNADGSADPSFGYQGMILPAMEYGSACVGAEIALRPDGKIIAVGVQGNEIAVQRFDSTGSPDPSFGVDGKIVFTPAGKDGGAATAVGLQPDGKIVIVGNAWSSGQDIPGLIVRLNEDGSLDNSFGTAGIVFASLGQWTRFYRFLVQPDGKTLTFGERRASDSQDIAIIRNNPDGSLDSTFGSNGTLITSHVVNDSYGGAGLQPDGKFVVASWGYNPPVYGDPHRALVRYNSDGSIDTGFSADGVSTSSQYRIFSFAFQPDGKLVAFGSGPGSVLPNFTGISVVRLNSNGSLDTSFGTNGGSITPMGSNSYYSASRGVMQPDGKILVLGNLGDYNVYEFAILRYLGNPTFSVSGRVTTPTGLGVRNAVVTLTDPQGTRRSVLSSTLGFYSFSDILAGQSVTITGSSRRYRFEPVTRTVNQSLTEVDLVALE